MTTRARCADCGVLEGELHKKECDRERCPFCGGQLNGCECANRHFYPGYERRFGHPSNRFSEADRAHAKACKLSDWTCPVCAEIEKRDTWGLPASVYFQGLHDDQRVEWDRLVNKRGRIPFIVYPNMCCRCGMLWPGMFRVPDKEWERYVEPAMQGQMLCQTCYDWIKRVIDEAAKGQ